MATKQPTWNEFRGLYNVDPRTIDELPTELFTEYLWNKNGLKPPDLKEQKALIQLVTSTCKELAPKIAIECDTSFNDRTALISFHDDTSVNESMLESLRASLNHAPYWRLLYDPALNGMEVLIYPNAIVFEGEAGTLGQHLKAIKQILLTSNSRTEKYNEMQIAWIKEQIRNDEFIFQKVRSSPKILGAFDNGRGGCKEYNTLAVWSLEYHNTTEACWMDGMENQLSYKGMTQLNASFPNEYNILKDGTFVPFTGKKQNPVGVAVCNGFDLARFEGYVCFRNPILGIEVRVDIAPATIQTFETLERLFN